jgi:hypothetical protein
MPNTSGAAAASVAPKGVVIKPTIATNRKMLFGYSNTCRPCANRSTSRAPITASSVWPIAKVTDEETTPVKVR